MDDFDIPVGRNPDGSVAFNTDARRNQSIVKFYKRRVLNPFKSEQSGSPQYDYKDFMELIQAGDKSTIVDKEVIPDDKRVFAHQWNQYKAEEEQTPQGVPLLHLFPANPEIVDTLKGYRFSTIEQLAEASDTAMQAVPMGGYEYREKAKKYLEFSKDAGKFHAIETKIAENNFVIARLEQTIAAMQQAALGSGEPLPPPRNLGGRPRKDAA